MRQDVVVDFFFSLYDIHRLGLCSKAICEEALKKSNGDLEKAASSLLDEHQVC